MKVKSFITLVLTLVVVVLQPALHHPMESSLRFYHAGTAEWLRLNSDGTLFAQAAPGKADPAKPPTLPEVATLRLDKAVLTFQSTQQQIQLLQAELKQQQADLQDLFKSYEKPGWSLSRDAQGAWAYVAAPKPPVK